jgi:N-acetylglutamate synthase-like GNAT family acetyltransferase
MDIQYLGDRQEGIPILAAWIYNEWSYLYPGATLQDFEDLLRERINKKSLPLTLVAIEAGEPVGTASLKAFDMETRSDLTPWLTSLYVAKPWRRRGIGSNLVKAIEQKAVELEIRKLFLFTTDAALVDLFYSRLGWIVKEKTIYHSYPVIIMEKDLC